MRFGWLLLFVVGLNAASAQMADDDVDGLVLQNLAGHRVKLTWKAEPSIPCLYNVVYSVFRSEDENFEPNESNRLIAGVKATSASVTDNLQNSYYHVRPVHIPAYCAPPKRQPGDHGKITIHPISDDEGGLLVSLRTKWRPENTQKGTLSYIISGIYLGKGDSAAYYTQARRCAYSLQLLDSQGFKIREIALDILGTTAEASKIVGIEANDLALLTSEQYRDFAQDGDWNLAWNCSKY